MAMFTSYKTQGRLLQRTCCWCAAPTQRVQNAAVLHGETSAVVNTLNGAAFNGWSRCDGRWLV